MSQLLILHKGLQGLVISEDLYEQVSVFEFWMSVFKAVNNGQEFFVVDVVVTLCWYHALVVECH